MKILRREDLLTTHDAAALCGVKVNTIRVWVNRGILPVAAVQSGRNLFRAVSVAEADRLTRSRDSRPVPRRQAS